ncbi:GAF and ANTAR domain-containing protein [Umezawaea endophytica]|uniref:GAF and ANTAR domain-containing protein n=1 Tax=Umezawaea endophytica TaxID=1654476 RepID=A0A9X2VWG3_9PSEU|nr:GAF and ANTAR domain-containing protein [Umezawaea endophytica]MCS7482963.1 GAF and ANTAR domain-containing protein [Umezawaea endophytica]
MFVELADTLVADFDIADFLVLLTERCVELLDVSAAGVILNDPGGDLRLVASSSQRVELLELFAIQVENGPCVECARTGQPVACHDLATDGQRWPRYTAGARECGFRAVQALPMRLRDHTIGALTLLGTEPGALDIDHVRLGQALSDVATIGILQHRTIERGDQVASQLQTALTSRVAIEQARGVLAERGGLSMDEAFTALRGYARANNHRLTVLAVAVVQGTVDLDSVLVGRKA